MPERITESDVIKKLYAVPLEENEIVFTFFGWAGIILRTKNHAIAIDIGKKCVQKREIKSIKHLDLQLYSHTHWDHFSLPVTKKIFEVTEASVIAEPQVAVELTNDIPADKLKSLSSNCVPSNYSLF